MSCSEGDQNGKRTWKITLADGTSLDGLDLNGNNYISSAAVAEATFAGKLSSVTIEGPDGTQTYRDMKLVQISKVGKSYWFILAEKTAEESRRNSPQLLWPPTPTASPTFSSLWLRSMK